MLADKDILVFSDDWGRHPFSCQHIMQHFLPHNRLLWVQTIGLRTPQLTLYDVLRSFEKIRTWFSPPENREQIRLPEHLHVVSPVMIPFNNMAAVRAFNRRSVIKTVRRAIRNLGMRQPVLLATLPNACDYIGAFDETLTVYYCVDDFTQWPGMNQPEMVRNMEISLLEQADLVAATSESLVRTRICPKGPTRLLSHGVDVDHFSAAGSSSPVPEELRALAGPVIGFYGLIDERLDEALLAFLLDSKPDWTLVCIGMRRVPLRELAKRPNFLWIPPVPYADLPRYAARFDVAIVPYVVDERTENINPLKIREYIATGKPVAATPLPEAARLRPTVRIGKTGDEFLKAVEECLADTTSPQERLKVLQGETWADKAELLSGWMREALAARRPDQEQRI